MIEVSSVCMQFKMPNDKVSSLKEYLVALLKRKISYHYFEALKDVTFSVNDGEVLGIIGANGAGKSTLLKVISGILRPTSGKCNISGHIAPLLELGAGFDPDLSARENIYLNGAILGYSRCFLEERFDDILTFAELEDFVDIPIRNYSSGMTMRLAFSIATIVQPEILIVDEILSVGDEGFQRKSRERMHQLMAGKTTVLFVSHDLDTVVKLCNRVLWLEKGRVRQIGEAKEICQAYLLSVEEKC